MKSEMQNGALVHRKGLNISQVDILRKPGKKREVCPMTPAQH